MLVSFITYPFTFLQHQYLLKRICHLLHIINLSTASCRRQVYKQRLFSSVPGQYSIMVAGMSINKGSFLVSLDQAHVYDFSGRSVMNGAILVSLDRAHGNDFSNQFEDSCNKLAELVKRQTQHVDDQRLLLQTLNTSETFYEEQYREAKIVANVSSL